VIEVRLGLRNAIRIDAVAYPIVKERNGWHRIDGLANGPRRVRFELLHDRFRTDSTDGRIVVQFRLRHSGFEWQGARYRIGPMILFRPLCRGPVIITRQENPVMTGRLTYTGVRLDYIAGELEPISPELALGLALRGQAYLDVLSGAGSDYVFVPIP